MEIAKAISVAGYPVIDLSDDDTAKTHVRYMIGGHPPALEEQVYSFEFPEHPGALARPHPARHEMEHPPCSTTAATAPTTAGALRLRGGGGRGLPPARGGPRLPVRRRDDKVRALLLPSPAVSGRPQAQTQPYAAEPAQRHTAVGPWRAAAPDVPARFYRRRGGRPTATGEQARRIAIRAQLLDTPRPSRLVEADGRLTLQLDPTAAVAPV